MTEFLRNCWYVAAESAEVTAQPLARRLLDKPVALYRGEDGMVAAVQDRCPHRFVPLSMGKVVGDALVCPYHGLQFDAHGRCVLNPHEGGGKSTFRIEAYPVTERYGYIWIWLGNEELADEDLLPDLPFLNHSNFRVVRGYLSVAGHHELVSDNLLDLSHVEFLHPLLARPAGVAAHKQEFYQEGDFVVSNRWKPDSEPNGFLRMFTDSDERLDARANMTWMPPGNLSFDLGACKVGGEPEEGLCTPAAHLLTPETAHSTHYFWAQARNERLDDPALDALLQEETARLFETEDRIVIEAQQSAMGEETDIFKLKPLLFKPDGPTVLARRILARLITAEKSRSAADSANELDHAYRVR